MIKHDQIINWDWYWNFRWLWWRLLTVYCCVRCLLTWWKGLRVLATYAMISLWRFLHAYVLGPYFGKSADLLRFGHKGFLPKKSLPRWGRRLSSWSMVITLHRECPGRSEVLSSMNRNQHLGAARTFCRDRWESFEVPQKSRSPFRGLASLRLISMRWTLLAAYAALLI